MIVSRLMGWLIPPSPPPEAPATQHWIEESPGHAPAMKPPPEQKESVFLHVPLPKDVLQLLLMQHWLLVPPGQYPATWKPSQSEMSLHVPSPSGVEHEPPLPDDLTQH
jgi:hypothetical protein